MAEDEKQPAEQMDEQAEPEAAAAESTAEAEAEVAEAEEPAAEAEPAEEPAAEAEPEAAPEVPVSEPKRKRKRLPRSERRRRAKPKRERPKERRPIVRLLKPEAARGSGQERRGVVVSHAMDKTIVVRVETLKSHPRYKKIIRRSSKLHAHDERNEAKVGDVVRIVETRPLSRTKRWRLAEVLEVAK